MPQQEPSAYSGGPVAVSSLDGLVAVGYDESINCRLGGMAVTYYFGDALSTLSTLLIVGVLAYISISVTNHRKIALWGKRVGFLAITGFLACIFAAARDDYYLSVQASTDSGAIPGLYAIDSVQSILGSLGGAIMVILIVSALFFRKQRYRKTTFFILSIIIITKTLLIEVGRILK